MGTLKGTREKKNLGQGENQQSEVPQELRKENVLSSECHRADALGKAENEDGGQDFNSAMFSEAEPQWRGCGKGQIKC